MAWTKVVDRGAIEILLHDRRADVGRARNGGRIPEPLADAAHHRGNLPLRVRLRLGQPDLRQADRRLERPAPRAEVLRTEVVAEVDVHVVVEPLAGEVVDVALPFVPEEPRAAPQRE